MTKFIKQEVNVFNGANEKRCYYRIENKGTLSLTDIAEQIACPGSGVNKGTALHVLETFFNEMACSLGKGYNIYIQGLGRFKVRLDEKSNTDMNPEGEDETTRNAASIMVSDIRFRADKYFIERTNHFCRLKKGGTRTVMKSPYSKQERLKLALSFLDNPQNVFMRTDDYMGLTKQSRSKARVDLVEFRNDPASGIVSSGKGNYLVYKKRLS